MYIICNLLYISIFLKSYTFMLNTPKPKIPTDISTQSRHPNLFLHCDRLVTMNNTLLNTNLSISTTVLNSWGIPHIPRIHQQTGSRIHRRKQTPDPGIHHTRKTLNLPRIRQPHRNHRASCRLRIHHKVPWAWVAS